MNRAYALLDIKSVDNEARIVRGTATTPTTDRVGDIIEPLGVEFKNPMPLLWQHKHDKPVGQVNFKKPTKNGIDFEARISKSEGLQSATLRDRLDEAWESVKLGLVPAVSIGFRAKEFSFMKETDGIHFQETEVMELSLVTIPANMEAVIHEIKSIMGEFRPPIEPTKNLIAVMKSIDAPLLAASGLEASERPQRPGVSGKERDVPVIRWHKPIDELLAPKDAKKMPTTAENIAAYEAKCFAKSERMAELMKKAADESVTLDAAESEEYDTLEAEVGKIKEHLVRLNKFEQLNKSLAKPVVEPPKTGSSIILPDNARISVKGNCAPPGTGFVRLAIAEMYGKGDTMKKIARAKEWAGDMPELIPILEAGIPNLIETQFGQKAAVSEGTTLSPTWAGPLVTYNILTDQFISLLRPLTIIGRLALRRVPFNIQMPATTSGTTVGWVGESAPKPVSAMAFATVTMRWAKAAGIVVLTEELVKFSNPAAEAVVRDDLLKTMVQFLDRQFIDPAVAAVTNVSPASITNGVTPTFASGTNEAALRSDIATMFAGFLSQNLSLTGGSWIMTQQQAVRLSLMINALGQPSFPTITGEGGTLAGYPVVASENLPAVGGSPADGFPLIFALAPEIMLADDGQTVIDSSNQASVQMQDASSLDSPPSSATNMISLWQLNMVGLRCERYINWQKRRATAVAYISNAKYA
jgi:HK97 family phage major capsid protein/HK97 family phage prohead protease